MGMSRARLVERMACVATAISVGVIALAFSQAQAGAKPHHQKVKRCLSGQLTEFKLRGGKLVLAKPRQHPPKGARVLCLVVLKPNAPSRPIASVGFSDAFSQLPPGVRRKFHSLSVVMRKLIGPLETAGRPSATLRARRSGVGLPRAAEAASDSWSDSSGGASGTGSAHSSPVDTPDTSGFDGGGTTSATDSIDNTIDTGTITMSMSDSKHYQNDKCPGADGKLRNGTYDQEVNSTVQVNAHKLGRGALTWDVSIKATYEADVADDGEPTQVTGQFSFELRTHKAIPPRDYDYSRVDVSGTWTVPLKNGSRTSEDPPWHVTWGGNPNPTEMRGFLESGYREMIRDVVQNVEKKDWQTPNACARLKVKADQQTAPTGGQIKLTFTAKAHDGSPLSTPLTITSSCPGTLSDTHPTTDSNRTTTITLSDPDSKWRDSTGACVSATMQTRAGQGEAKLSIPPKPPSEDRVSGNLSLSVTYHDTCDTGNHWNETDSWSGTGSIDESYDPSVDASSADPYTRNSTLNFSGSWSSGGCPQPNGPPSVTDSGTSQASVSGQDGTTNSGGVAAYWDTPSQGQLALYLDWPVDGTDNCQDVGTNHVSGTFDTEIDVPIPPGGSGTVSIDQVLPYGGGDNQWAKGWGPSCSGTPSQATVHLTGSLTIHA